jgi:hypothetical protein
VAPQEDDGGEPRWLLAKTLRDRLGWLIEEAFRVLPWRPWTARRRLSEAVRLLDEDGNAG